MKNTKVGDVYVADIGNGVKKYLQYIVSDLTQLNSDVIRVFKKEYPIDSSPNLNEIVDGEVEFYAHCATKFGIKQGYWKKVGNIDQIGQTNILFRDIDIEERQNENSNNWWIWRVNEEMQHIGKLKNENKEAEIGLVFAPERIYNRMKTGNYSIVYPKINTNS